MEKLALCVGIDAYAPPNTLEGCVTDMQEWSGLIQAAGFEVTMLQDKHGTRVNVLGWLDDASRICAADDEVFVSYSGHGTYAVDTSGDEPDRWDEALYLYDGVLLDDELREIIGQFDEGVKIVFVCDSCFSGTVTRALAPHSNRGKARFVTPPDMPAGAKIGRKLRDLFDEESMAELLLSGCADDEVSYEMYADGEHHGAFSYYATRTLAPRMTYQLWMDTIHDYLPSSDFPQTPQLEGKAVNKYGTVFGAGSGETPGKPSGCMSTLGKALIKFLSELASK